MRFLFRLASSAVIFAAAVIVFLGYSGFASQPKDLGVRYSSDDLKNAHDLTGIKWTQGKTRFKGEVEIQKSLSDREITALLQHNLWRYNIIPDSQIKFNNDGTFELAGHLYVTRLKGYFEAHKMPEGFVKPVLNLLSYTPVTPTYYLRAKASIKNNSLNLDIKTLEVGGASALTGIASKNNVAVADFVQRYILSAVPNLNIRSLTISKGQVRLDSIFPKEISIAN